MVRVAGSTPRTGRSRSRSTRSTIGSPRRPASVRCLHRLPAGRPDVARVEDRQRALGSAPMTVTWSAPGRVNLIGEHVDYNGGRVLPFAIDRRTEVTHQPENRLAGDRDLTGARVRPRSPARCVQDTAADGSATSREPSGRSSWAPATTWTAWTSTSPARCPPGPDSRRRRPSSVASWVRSATCSSAGLTARQIAALALRAEQEYVGVPCGPMDQYAVMLGEVDHALLARQRHPRHRAGAAAPRRLRPDPARREHPGQPRPRRRCVRRTADGLREGGGGPWERRRSTT